jgi:hypothetical protein
VSITILENVVLRMLPVANNNSKSVSILLKNWRWETAFYKHLMHTNSITIMLQSSETIMHWRITLVSQLNSKPSVRLRNRKIVEDNIGARDSRYPASLHMSLTWSSICGLWDWKSAPAVVLGTMHHLQYQCGSSAQVSCLRNQYRAVVACGVEVTSDKVGSQVGSGCITELVNA